MRFGKIGWMVCWLVGLESLAACIAALVGEGGLEFGHRAALMMASSKVMRGTGMEFPAARQIPRVI